MGIFDRTQPLGKRKFYFWCPNGLNELTASSFWLWCYSVLSSLGVATEGSLVFECFLPWVCCAFCCSGLKQARGREQRTNNRLGTTSVWKISVHLKEKKNGKGRWVLILGHWAWVGKQQLILPTSTLGFPGVKKGFFGLGLGGGGVQGFLGQQNYIEFGSYLVLIQADIMPRRAEIQRPSPNFPMQQHGACLLGDSPCISLKYLLLGFQYVGK